MWFGDFDYDPATTKEKAAEFGIEYYDTIETDGLKSEWNYSSQVFHRTPSFRQVHRSQDRWLRQQQHFFGYRA